MPSRRFRRKYQTGGSVVPNFQGSQVLSRPQVINQQVNPIVFDPNAAFQAVANREQSKRTALSQGQLNRNERLDIWQKEERDRDFLYRRLDDSLKKIQNGTDQLTKLDMNIPAQFKMAQDMRRQLDVINNESAVILTDNSLAPQDRLQRLQEQINKSQKLFTDPNYIKFVQNNQIAGQIYKQTLDASTKGDQLIDFGTASDNLALADQLQRGVIDRATMAGRLKNFTLDHKTADAWEKKIDGYMRDILDPDKAATNWEKYQDDDDFLIFQEKFSVPSLDEQVDALYELYTNNPGWLKVQEARGNRSFLDDQGLVDQDNLRNFLRRKVELVRGSLGAQGKDIITDVKVSRRGSASTGTGGGGGRTAGERRTSSIINELSDMGYDVVNPSVLDNIESAPEAIRIINTPDSEFKDKNKQPDEFMLNLKRDLEQALRPKKVQPVSLGQPDLPETLDQRTIEEIFKGPAPVNFSDILGETAELTPSGYLLHNNLVIGDNNGAVPKNRGGIPPGFYTNNFFNLKGSDKKYPVVKSIDRSERDQKLIAAGKPGLDTSFYRIFDDPVEGFYAGVDVVRGYQTGRNDTFTSVLADEGKTLEEATIRDMFEGVYAEKGNLGHSKIIARVAGVPLDTPIVNIPTERLAFGVLAVENPQMYRAITQGLPPTNVAAQEEQVEETVESAEQKAANEVSIREKQRATNIVEKAVEIDNELVELNRVRNELVAFGDDDSVEQVVEIDKEIAATKGRLEKMKEPLAKEIRRDRAKDLAVESVLDNLNEPGSSTYLDGIFDSPGRKRLRITRSQGDEPKYRIRYESRAGGIPSSRPGSIAFASPSKIGAIISEEELIEVLKGFKVNARFMKDLESNSLIGEVTIEDLNERLNRDFNAAQPAQQPTTQQQQVTPPPAQKPAQPINKKTNTVFFDTYKPGNQ